MMDFDKYIHKPFFEREPVCGKPPHHEKPRYTMTEEVEHTARLMRETIDRLLKFEDRAKSELADLSRNVTADNVIFKNTMHEAWTTFLMEVKNEINVFENNLEADVKLFKDQVETDYATLSEDVRTQVAENLATYEQKQTEFEEQQTAKYSEFVTTVQNALNQFETRYEQEFTELSERMLNQYNSFVEAVNSRCDLHNENMAQALADYQQKLNTELNSFEQTMNTNYETFTESVGNTIHTFKETWEQIITERLAAQDGVISDAEMYMKSNLGATVATHIGDMHANGELTNIIEGEVFTDLQSKSKLEYHEATAIEGGELCAAYCRANNKVFYVPRGSVFEVEETLDLTGIDVEVNGEIRIKHNGIGIICGGSSAKGEVRTVYIRNITHENYVDGDISVRLVGLMRGNVVLENVPVIQVYADGDVDEIHAVGYSMFNIGTCRKLMLEDKEGATGLGWINENFFNVNRVTELLSITGHTFAHDNNVFIKPCIEGAKLVLKNCVRNKFYDIRSEGNFTAEFDENSRYNYVVDNFHWASIERLDNLTDNGRNNVYTNAIYESMENVPFFMVNGNTIEKYDVYAREKFTVEGDTITPTALYSKLIMDAVIPVDGVSFIGMDCDRWAFQLYVTPLNANKEVMFNNPLDYTGGVRQNADSGAYCPSDATATAFLEIVNPAVKYLKITLDTCPTEIKSFEHVVLYAMGKKRNAAKLHLLAEQFKV